MVAQVVVAPKLGAEDLGAEQLRGGDVDRFLDAVGMVAAGADQQPANGTAPAGATRVADGDGWLTFGPVDPPAAPAAAPTHTSGGPAGTTTPTNGAATMANGNGNGPITGAVGDIISWQTAVQVFHTLAQAADQINAVSDIYLLAAVQAGLPPADIVEGQRLAEAGQRLVQAVRAEQRRIVQTHGAIAEARQAAGGSADRSSYYTEGGSGNGLTGRDASAALPGGGG